MNNILLIILSLLFETLFLYEIFYLIVKIIKSKKFKNIDAKVIDNVIIGSKEWGKYFPDEYKRNQKVGNAVKKVDNIIDKLATIRDIKSIISGKNISYKKNSELVDESEENYTMIAEYEVNNKKYYYYETFVNSSTTNNPFKKMLGKSIKLKYDPKNPKNNIRKESNVKGLIFMIFITIITFVLTYFLLK